MISACHESAGRIFSMPGQAVRGNGWSAHIYVPNSPVDWRKVRAYLALSICLRIAFDAAVASYRLVFIAMMNG